MSVVLLLSLSKLFPDLNLSKVVRFPNVQQQPPGDDCGVFAIANAETCLFKENPRNFQYDCSKMRPHLIKIFKTGQIEPFPKRNDAGNGWQRILTTPSFNCPKPLPFKNEVAVTNRQMP